MTDTNDDAKRLIPTDEFHALFREEAERLSGFVPTLKGEQLRPMVVAILDREDGNQERKRALIAVAAMPEGEEKRKVMLAVGAEVAKKRLRIVAAFLISEAWAKFLTPAEGWRAKRHGVPQPSKSPDRRETVVLWGRTLDGRVALGMAPMDRKGGKVTLGEWRLSGPGDEIEDNLLGHFFDGYLIGFGGQGK